MNHNYPCISLSNASLSKCICLFLSSLIVCQISTNCGLLALCASLMYVSIVSYKKSASLPRTFKISYAVSVNSVEEDDIFYNQTSTRYLTSMLVPHITCSLTFCSSILTFLILLLWLYLLVSCLLLLPLDAV